MASWVQLPPAHEYACPCTVKVRNLVQAMWSTSEGRNWMYLADRWWPQGASRSPGSSLLGRSSWTRAGLPS